MKVLKKGKIWTVQRYCTGWGNGDNGCEALLEIEKDDLRFFEKQEYPWVIKEAAVSFKCPCCGKVTDLGREAWPDGYEKLNPWTQAWADAE